MNPIDKINTVAGLDYTIPSGSAVPHTGKSGIRDCEASGSRLFGQPASYAVGNWRFGEADAEFRPRRLQNHADFGAQGLGHAAQQVQGMPLITGRFQAADFPILNPRSHSFAAALTRCSF